MIQQNQTNDFRTVDLPYDSCRILLPSFDDTLLKPSCRLTDTILHNSTTVKIRIHWSHRGFFAPSCKQKIDWDVFKKSVTNLPPPRQLWLSKLLSGFYGVGIMMEIYKKQSHSKCPRCLRPNESTDHVILCRHPEAIASWETQLLNLRTWMNDNRAPPGFVDIICSSLSSWHDGIPFPPLPLDPTLRDACVDQDRIGWKGFMHGFQSLKWRYHLYNNTLLMKVLEDLVYPRLLGRYGNIVITFFIMMALLSITKNYAP